MPAASRHRKHHRLPIVLKTLNQRPDWPHRLLLAFAALLAATAVAMAALGSHAFADILVGRAQIRFDSALRMHLMHAPALLALGTAYRYARQRWWQAAAALISGGCLIFCGGLYLAALGVSELVLPVVPAGGSLMIAGWLLAIVAFARGAQ